MDKQSPIILAFLTVSVMASCDEVHAPATLGAFALVAALIGLLILVRPPWDKTVRRETQPIGPSDATCADPQCNCSRKKSTR